MVSVDPIPTFRHEHRTCRFALYGDQIVSEDARSGHIGSRLRHSWLANLSS